MSMLLCNIRLCLKAALFMGICRNCWTQVFDVNFGGCIQARVVVVIAKWWGKALCMYIVLTLLWIVLLLSL